MAPWVSANGRAKLPSTEFDSDWFVARPELQAQANFLAGQLEPLIEALLNQFENENFVAHKHLHELARNFTLTLQLDNPDALYIHVGHYNPDSTHRFSIGKLRNAAGGVKPWGVASGQPDTWQNGVLTQDAVLQQAMDFMTQVVEELQDDDPDPGLGGFGGFGLGGLFHPAFGDRIVPPPVLMDDGDFQAMLPMGFVGCAGMEDDSDSEGMEDIGFGQGADEEEDADDVAL